MHDPTLEEQQVAGPKLGLVARIPHPKRATARQHVEALLRFLTSARLAEIAAEHTPEGMLPPKLAGELRQAIQVPTFGGWRAMLAEVVQLGGSRSALMPELSHTHAALQTLLGTDMGRALSLIGLRNALAHGGAISAALARAELDHWGPRCALAFEAAAWLSELRLVAGDPRGTISLNGARPGEPASPGAGFEAIPLGSVIMGRGQRRVSLAPFGRFAPVTDGAQAIVQGFVRRGTTSLVYATLHSDDAMQTEGDKQVLDAFERLFDLPAARPAARAPASGTPAFELDMVREAAGFVGRVAELERLWRAVVERPEGVLWVDGVPGVGKSALIGAPVHQSSGRVRRGGPSRRSAAGRAAVSLPRWARSLPTAAPSWPGSWSGWLWPAAPVQRRQ